MVFLFSENAVSQVSIMGGVNYNYVRNNGLLKNEVPIMAGHFGSSFRCYPFKKIHSLSVQSDLLFTQKGYYQKFDKNYTVLLNYVSWTFLLNYAPIKDFSINTGTEFSGLFFTSVIDGTRTYNNSDIGLVLGIGCLEHHRISLYARTIYGISPILNYYTFDKLGNFTGDTRDLKNMTISVGIKINLYNEKIYLFR
jgi:hypothetical protein